MLIVPLLFLAIFSLLRMQLNFGPSLQKYFSEFFQWTIWYRDLKQVAKKKYSFFQSGWKTVSAGRKEKELGKQHCNQSWFRVVVFEETWNILQPNTPPQANALPPLDTHRKSLTKDLQRPTLTNQWWSHYTVIPPLPQPALPWTRDRATSGSRLRKRTRTRSWCRSWPRRARSRLRFVCFWHLWRKGHFSIIPKNQTNEWASL